MPFSELIEWRTASKALRRLTSIPSFQGWGMSSPRTVRLRPKRDAFAAATIPGADGKIDYGRAILGLAQADPQAAALFAQRQNHEDTLAQQAITNKRAEEAAAESKRQFGLTYGLQARRDARADDPTPDNFVADPSVPGGYRPIGPADPAYQEKLAAAKARAAATLPPEGFAQGPDGTLIPRAGGPTDPAYLARVDAEKARARGDVPTIIGPGSSSLCRTRPRSGPSSRTRTSPAADFPRKPRNSRSRSGTVATTKARQRTSAEARKAAPRWKPSPTTQRSLLTEEGLTPDDAAAHVSSNMQKFKASGITRTPSPEPARRAKPT
jgi:hypothetical protein